MIAKTGKRGQKMPWTRKAGAGQLEQDSWYGTAGTGKSGLESRDRIAREESEAGQDRENMMAGA